MFSTTPEIGTFTFWKGGDTGRPIVLTEPESEQAKMIQSVARKLAAQISISNMSAASKPKIEIEM